VAHAVTGGDGEEKENVDAAAALPNALAPMEAPSVYSCGGAEEKRGFDGDAAAAFGGARGRTNRGGGGALRRVAGIQLIGLLRGEGSVS
jgi:hypothetical protein